MRKTRKELADMFGMKLCTLNHYIKRLGLVNDKSRNKKRRRYDRNRTAAEVDRPTAVQTQLEL